MARQCLVVTIRHQSLNKVFPTLEETSQQLIKSESMRETEQRGLLCEEQEKVIIGIGEDKYFQVGTQLPLAKKEELLGFLRKNIDIFACSAYEAPEVDPDFICHHLNVNPTFFPKRQPPRHSFKEHAEAVKEEVDKLKQARAIKEAFYPKWLANTIMVKKKSEKWRVCVDFTDFNKAYPKDHFLIPLIDQLVDTTLGHLRMSFLDAF